jgi:hypothetical protein
MRQPWAPNATLTPDQVVEIKVCLRHSERNNRIAERFGVGKSAVSRIKTGKAWRTVAP